MASSPTKKLFHVVVVVGMGATVAGCSSTNTNPQDASTDALASNDGSANKDVQAADVSVSDAAAGADACAGWAPCC